MTPVQQSFADAPAIDARRSDPEPSHEAGRTARRRAQEGKERVKAKLLLHPEGLADFELQKLLPDMNEGSVEKRRGDWCKEKKVVAHSTKKAPSGVRVTVWKWVG